MTHEEQYAERWRQDAKLEGHRRRLPQSFGANQRLSEDEVIRTIKRGFDYVSAIAAVTGYSETTVKGRLRDLKDRGIIYKQGNQWRVTKNA